VSLRLAERFNLTDFAYAHRGLWSETGPPENSLAAFDAASKLGLGIELDLRPSSDGVPMIFHDPVLDRMTQTSGDFAAHSASELSQIDLIGGGNIPTLTTLLEQIDPKTPLLCELKIDGDTEPEAFTRRVAEILDGYAGRAAMMSFSEIAVETIPKSIMRGQLITPSSNAVEMSPSPASIQSVDYIAPHISDAQNEELQALRATYPLITWTVRETAMCNALVPFTDSQIFEAFDPALAKSNITRK